MPFSPRSPRSALALGYALALAALACSGGGSGASKPPSPPPPAIAIDAVTTPAGTSAQLTARLGGEALRSGLRFESSNPAVALVNDAGLLLAVAPGQARITATQLASGVSGSATVTVSAATLQAIAVEPATVFLPAGFERALSVSGRFSDGTVAPLASGVAFGTSSAATAGVSASGVLSGERPGTATVTATHAATGLHASAAVRVTDARLVSLSLDAGAFLFQDYASPVTVVGHFSDGSAVPLVPEAVTFSSSDPVVASVDAAGVVHGQADGRSMITATHAATGMATGEWFYVSPTYDLALDGELPAPGSVGERDALFRVHGVVPGQWYSVALPGASDWVPFQAYADLDGGMGCGSWNDGSDVSCTLQATGTTLYVDASAMFAAAGATFTVEVTPSAGPAYPELTANAAPLAGTASDEPVTYALTGLTPGAYYLVTLGGLAADADLAVYADAGRWSQRCSSWQADTTADVCAVQAPASGTLFVEVSPMYSTPFTLAAASLAPPVPVPAAALPLSEHVATAAVYAVDGLVAGQPYDVTAAAGGADVDLRVFADAALTRELCESTRVGADAEGCTTEAVPSGRAYVWVDATRAHGADVVVGAALRQPPPVDETLVYGASVPAARTASGAPLRYRIGGLVPGASYGVALTGLGGDLDLAVHASAWFDWTTCSAAVPGTAAETCDATADAAGDVFVEVTAPGAGGDFTLAVVPAALAEPLPLDAALDLPLPVYVKGTAEYDLVGLAPGQAYRVRTTGITGDVDLTVYADASRTARLCYSSWISATYEERCAFTAPADGSVQVLLDAQRAPGGAALRVELEPYVIPGLAGTLATFPQTLSVANGAEDRYAVTGLVPFGTYAVTLTGLTADVDVWTYYDRELTQLYSYSRNDGLADESAEAMANEAGVVYVDLDGRYMSSTAASATFTLDVAPLP